MYLKIENIRVILISDELAQIIGYEKRKHFYSSYSTTVNYKDVINKVIEKDDSSIKTIIKKISANSKIPDAISDAFTRDSNKNGYFSEEAIMNNDSTCKYSLDSRIVNAFKYGIQNLKDADDILTADLFEVCLVKSNTEFFDMVLENLNIEKYVFYRELNKVCKGSFFSYLIENNIPHF